MVSLENTEHTLFAILTFEPNLIKYCSGAFHENAEPFSQSDESKITCNMNKLPYFNFTKNFYKNTEPTEMQLCIICQNTL